jgi:biopolymer transport protein TolR
MAIGSGSKGEEPITAINVTPLVDVCLVLVIIFMAVAPFALTQGIKVLESRAKAAQGKASADENVNVKLTADGRLTINGKQIDPAQLAIGLTQAINASKDKMVIISADETNHVGQVVEILDTAKVSGALKLAILKNEEAPAKAAPGGKS